MKAKDGARVGSVSGRVVGRKTETERRGGFGNVLGMFWPWFWRFALCLA